MVEGTELSWATKAHAAGVRIIGGTGGNRQHAGTGCGDLVLGRGGRGLGGGGCTGEDEDDDECADNKLHDLGPYKVLLVKLLITNDLMSIGLSAGTRTAKAHATSVRIVGRAGRNRQHAGAGCDDLVLRGGGGGLGGGDSAGENQDDDKSADKMFHSGIPLKLYLLKKIFLDNQIR